MSWFDGIIPETCRNCFYFQQGQWQMIEGTEFDDSCDFYLSMFPVLMENHKVDHAKLDILYSACQDPQWQI